MFNFLATIADRSGRFPPLARGGRGGRPGWGRFQAQGSIGPAARTPLYPPLAGGRPNRAPLVEPQHEMSPPLARGGLGWGRLQAQSPTGPTARTPLNPPLAGGRLLWALLAFILILAGNTPTWA